MQVIRSGLLYLMQYAILQDIGTNCGHTALQLPGPQPDHPRSTRFTGRTCRNWKNQCRTGSPPETGSCTIQPSHHKSLGTGLHVWQFHLQTTSAVMCFLCRHRPIMCRRLLREKSRNEPKVSFSTLTVVFSRSISQKRGLSWQTVA